MNKLLGLSIISAAMALSACGGDSDSSGEHYSSSFTKTLANKNVYSCPSQVALDSCDTDASCAVASCTLVDEVVKPVDPSTTNTCNVSGNTVTGINEESCKFIADDADVIITCASGTMTLDGKLGGLTSEGGTFTSGANIYGYKVQCP